MNQMIQETLFEPSEADLVERAMNVPFARKVDISLETFRFYEGMCDERGYYLAFSGGKDSVVIKHLAAAAGVKFESWYNNTTIDPPELVQFVKRVHPDVQWNNPKQNMMRRMVEKSIGPPTRIARWCCEEYKEQGGNGWPVKVIGVRVAESARRAKLWKTFVRNRNEGHILCPILYWTDEDVWRYIRENEIPYCKLYDEGFKRLGCVGCPLGGPNAQKVEFERWPRYEANWKKHVIAYWEKWHDVPTIKGRPRWVAGFASGEALWNWWVSGKRKDDDDDDCQYQEMMKLL